MPPGAGSRASNHHELQAGLPALARRISVGWAKAFVWVYVASLVAWLIVRYLIGDSSILVSLFSYLGVWLFCPLLVLGPWALFRWRKPPALLLLIPAAMFIWFYGRPFLPRPPRVVAPNEPITVLTFNLRFLNRDTEALAETLLSSQADVLALQEMTHFHNQHLPEALEEHFAHHFYLSPAGLAVFSRYPILDQESLPMQPWPALSVIIDVNGKPLHLINAHLARAGILDFLMTLDTKYIRDAADARKAQIATIQDAVRQSGPPTIVACDCNMTDLTSAYAQLTTTLLDTHSERGWGFGHTLLVPRGLEISSTINVPLQRIDYLFHSPEIVATKALVLDDDGGSDHLPLVAQFDLSP
jgi:vancomycin resistance protein VanJ